jgi:phosphatidylinositol alpha-1,6-mannosyltransferase
VYARIAGYAARVRPPHVMLGADSLRRGASGIGRVARLMARVLAEEMDAGRLSAEAVVLSDTEPIHDLGIPVRSMFGSRAKFAFAMHRAAFRCSHFLYDFSGIARAHPRTFAPRRPYLVWMHGIEIWEDARKDRLRRAQCADVLVANTEYTRQRAIRIHSKLEHARVCWLATEEDDAAIIAPRRSGPPTALILSRIDSGGGYKGHRELIAAWPRVAQDVPGACLVIAGDGPGMPTVRAWADASPARDRIELLGFVPDFAIDQLFARASLFAMPSQGEGFGIAYAEAMRHGVPVLASIHDAAVEVNLEGETGYNVDLHQPTALARGLVSLLRADDSVPHMGVAARARWHEHFRYSAFAARFRPLLHHLMDMR